MNTEPNISNEDSPSKVESKGLRIVFVVYMLLCAIGIISSWHLVEVFRQTHIAPEEHDSFCNISEGMNCDKVAMHDEFSIFLETPVAIWAISGYLFVALLAAIAVFRTREKFGHGFLFIFGVLFVFISLWLIYAMHFEIGSWCIVCLAIDVINCSLFGLSVAAIRISKIGFIGAIRRDVVNLFKTPIITLGLAIAGTGLLAMAWFWGQYLQQNIHAAQADRKDIAEKQENAQSHKMLYMSQTDENLEEKKWSNKTDDTPQGKACDDKKNHIESDVPTVQVGVSKDGRYWKGAAIPKLEIQEFTDFQCPYCRNAHMLVNRLVSKYAGQLRVYHRHLPLDHHCNSQIGRPFHPRACELSRIAVCAGRQNRFFEMTDYLFHNANEIKSQNLSPEDIAKALALDLGKFDCCMDSPESMIPIEADLKAAAKHNLRGTPAFVVGDQVYYGKIPEDALKNLDSGNTENRE
ncbi:MAG: thioredoxin domain-containing protein [Deltaproteobacteria bacterium]|nr:thioredoxin domain-containing protein [Deltaproteobacteria bacterium]